MNFSGKTHLFLPLHAPLLRETGNTVIVPALVLADELGVVLGRLDILLHTEFSILQRTIRKSTFLYRKQENQRSFTENKKTNVPLQKTIMNQLSFTENKKINLSLQKTIKINVLLKKTITKSTFLYRKEENQSSSTENNKQINVPLQKTIRKSMFLYRK